MRANTTGGENTATGDEALYSNTTGDDNTANGAHAACKQHHRRPGNIGRRFLCALCCNTTGDRNTAMRLCWLYWRLGHTTGSEQHGRRCLCASFEMATATRRWVAAPLLAILSGSLNTALGRNAGPGAARR